MNRRSSLCAVLLLLGALLVPGAARLHPLGLGTDLDRQLDLAERAEPTGAPGSVAGHATASSSDHEPSAPGKTASGEGCGEACSSSDRTNRAHADEAPDFRVQVGAPSPDGDTALEFTRFYPDRLQVRRGQTVQFDTIDFHTVVFGPGGEDGRLPLVRRDEGPGRFALTEKAWQRSECGGPDQAACVLNEPDAELSAGLPVGDLTWRVQIDRPVGTTITYICNFHPGMNAAIEVVDDSRPLPTQEEIDAEVRSQVALDTQEAIDHAEMLEGDVAHREEGGRTVWTVLVGPATPSGNASILGYVPKRLESAQPGDAVEFVSSGPSGHHSVTFPSVLVGDNEVSPNSRLTLLAIHPACDFDDRAGGAPGISGAWPFTPVPCPASLEFVLSPYLANPHRAPRDLVATPATYHDSGLMWSEEAPETARGRPAGSGEYFLHRFVAEFPSSGVFEYACTIHGADFMAGTVEVG